MKTKKEISLMAKVLRRATKADFITCKKVAKGWRNGLSAELKGIEGITLVPHNEGEDSMLWWNEVFFHGISLDNGFFFIEIAKDCFRHLVELPLPERKRYFFNYAGVFCTAGYRMYDFNNAMCIEHGLETPDRRDSVVVWNEYRD